MAEENDLLRRYAETGDEEAFARFVARRAEFVYARALPRVGGDTHAAKDASQLVFVAVARNARKLASHPHLSGWLFNATRNACSAWVRGERRRKARELKTEHSLFVEPIRESHDSPPDIELLLDLLGERERTAIILRYFDNLSYSALGLVLRTSEEAARKCTERAVATLRRHLNRRGDAAWSVSVGALLARQRVHALPGDVPSMLARGALASSKALSVPSATLLIHAMTQSKLIASALGLAGLAFFAGGYRNHERIRALTAESEFLRAETNARHVRTGPAATKTATSRTAKKPATAPQEPSPDVKAAAESGRALILERSRLARTDPECEALMDQMVKGVLHEEYASYYRQHGLSGDQMHAIEDAVRNEELQETDIAAGAKAHGLSASDPGIVALLDQSKAALKTELIGVLGDSNYPSFADYQASVAQRDFVEEISGELWQARQPMSTEQFQQVLSAVEANTTTTGILITDSNWTQLEASVSRLLTPAQMPVWDAAILEQRYSTAVVRQMNHP